MSSAVEHKQKVWTEAELEALPEEGYLHEVVNGELVMSPKSNWLLPGFQYPVADLFKEWEW